MRRKGFSLIEILLGMALFAMVMSAAMSVLYSSLKSSRKAAAVTSAKAEGAYALRAMESMIRFATDIECINNNTVKVYRVKEEGEEIQDVIVYELLSNRIASRSANTAETPIPTSPPRYLTSTNMTVTTTTCLSAAMFTCSGDAVAICFEINNVEGMDLTDKAGVGGGLKFQTWVTARNIFD
jgi:prepilin-type N-terminal cleavage/methylation domain-containing protein